MNADLKAAAQQAFNLLDRLPINEGYHEETVEVLDALRAGLAAQAPAEAHRDATRYLIDAAQSTVTPWEPTPWMIAVGESVMMNGGKLADAYRAMLGSGPLHPAVMADSPFIVGGPQLDVQPKGTTFADWWADRFQTAYYGEPAKVGKADVLAAWQAASAQAPAPAHEAPSADDVERWREDLHKAALEVGGFGMFFAGSAQRDHANPDMKGYYLDQAKAANNVVNALMDLRDRLQDSLTGGE